MDHHEFRTLLIVDYQFRLSIDKKWASLERFHAQDDSVDNCLLIKVVANLGDALPEKKIIER